MAHNPLTYLLQKAFRQAINKTGIPARNDFDEGRRKFIRDGAMLTTGMGLLPAFAKAFAGEQQASITVVGAGMAGLNATYQLQKIGLHASLYEASARAGGRMFTIKNKFGANITTDIGGEYVDASHADIIALAHEFDITFYDLRQDKLAPQTFFFGGKYYTAKDLLDAIVPFSNKIENDVVSLPESLNYKTASSFEHLDKLSITEYIKKMGISGWLYDFINVVLTREYGIEASEQSAINLLIMFSQPKAGNQGYELFGDDHEILKITGGSQRLTDALLNKVKDELQFNHALTAIEKTTGGYTLTFDVKGKPKKIFTNYVVLAIPFTILRNIAFKVDMPEEKRRCINEIGYGNSGKFILGVDSKPWRKAGSRGYTFTDLHVGCGWDSSLMQSENEGSFTVFGGGKFMDEICNAGNDAVLQYVVPQLNTVYPGFAKAFNNKTTKFCWSKNTFSKAGYSAFKKGQWSTLAGWEPVPVGNIYFAGEHVSPDFQGYMNGAAKTGREAAEMIAKVVGPMKSVRLGY